MTQSTRILELLHDRGARGITPIDFALPTTDDGPPIMRVAARIHDLKGRGFGIETDSTGLVARYVLTVDAERGEVLHREVGRVSRPPRFSSLGADAGGSMELSLGGPHPGPVFPGGSGVGVRLEHDMTYGLLAAEQAIRETQALAVQRRPWEALARACDAVVHLCPDLEADAELVRLALGEEGE